MTTSSFILADDGHKLAPATLLAACLVATGTQGGTWAQHEPKLHWRNAHWRSRQGWEYLWVLEHDDCCQLTPVAYFIGHTRKEQPPTITPHMHDNPRVSLHALAVASILPSFAVRLPAEARGLLESPACLTLASIPVGSRFTFPQGTPDAGMVFTVIEDRDTRKLVRCDNTGMKIAPQHVFACTEEVVSL